MLDIAEHKTIMVQILKEIYSQTDIGPILGFKGGTAVYLFYNLPRFSVDLDFDLLNSNEEKFVYEKVKKILQNFGEIKEEANKSNTIFFLLSYSYGTINIKIEISKRSFKSEFELKDYLGVSMLVMKQEDIFASKLIAASQRKSLAIRDFFDIWFFLKNNWPINEQIIEIRLNKKLPKYLADLIEIIESKINEINILAGIGELIDNKTKDWLRKNLKQDLIFMLKLKIETLKK